MYVFLLILVIKMLYVIGHKNPDTDSVCSAVAYAYFSEKCSGCMIVPAIIGELNPETKFVLDKFGFDVPVALEKAKEGDKFQLVDHNSYDDAIDGIKDDMIVGVIDHHKLKLTLDSPRYVRTEPLGATSTIIAQMFIDAKTEIPKDIAGILLSAILSDTVVFKSPTTTELDKQMAAFLAKKAGIKDMGKFGVEIKKQKTDFSSISAEGIIRMDYKEFSAAGIKYAVGQVEVVDPKEINARKKEILKGLESIRAEKKLEFALLMVTDIMKEGTEFWAVGEVSKVEAAFGKKFVNGCLWKDKVMSRKKQVIPPIDKELES